MLPLAEVAVVGIAGSVRDEGMGASKGVRPSLHRILTYRADRAISQCKYGVMNTDSPGAVFPRIEYQRRDIVV